MALTLFQNITTELTDLEKETLVPMLIDTLSTTHEEKRITGKNICGWFKASGYAVTEVRIRKMVNYLRVLNLMDGRVVIGAGNGYYVTSDPAVVQEQIDSLQGRVDSMSAVIDSLKAVLISLKHKRRA
jgi:hypothetical protein